MVMAAEKGGRRWSKRTVLAALAAVLGLGILLPDVEWLSLGGAESLSLSVQRPTMLEPTQRRRRKRRPKSDASAGAKAIAAAGPGALATEEAAAAAGGADSVGPGGAMVLFLPCKIDGYWSNVRQVVASVYMARAFNLTYVSQDLFYKFQDSGRIGGIDGPVTVFDLFDREHMEQYFRTAEQGEFWQGKPEDSPVRDQIQYAGIDQGVRCEIKTNKNNLDKFFLRWLKLYELGKSGFLANKFKTRPEQRQLLRDISWKPASTRYIMSGTPRFQEVLKDYQLTSIYRTRADVPKFWVDSFETLQFSQRVRNLQAKGRALLGMAEDERYIAVHVRRGHTYAIGGKAGQATTDDVAAAVQRAKDCIGEPVRTIFVSTMLPFLKRETEMLRAAFPDHKVLGMGTDVTWDMLEPGLGARNGTITRAGVEMQFWFAADGFVGSRSTMSSFIQLMRLTHRDGDACNRFSQKKWAEQESKQAVP